MSVEFTLTGCRIEPDRWDELIEKHQDEIGELLCCDDRPLSETGEAQLFKEGGVRGVILYRRDDGDLGVRLGAFSSRADWRAAYSLIGDAIDEGGGTFTRETGVKLSREARSLVNAEIDAVQDLRHTVALLAKQVAEHSDDPDGQPDTIAIPVASFSLQIDPNTLSQHPKDAELLAHEKSLADRVSRYAEAFMAQAMVLDNGARVGTWSGVPTVLPKVHLVSCQGVAEEPLRLVPIEALGEILGDRAERLGQGGWFLAEVDLRDPKESEVRAALAEHLVALDDWVAEHEEDLEAEVAAAAEVAEVRLLTNEAAEQAHAGWRELLAVIVSRLGDGQDAETIYDELSEETGETELIETAIATVGMTIGSLHGEDGTPGTPADTFKRLNAAGVPGGIAMIAIELVLAGLGDDDDGDDGDDHVHGPDCDHDHAVEGHTGEREQERLADAEGSVPGPIDTLDLPEPSSE